MPAYAKQFGPSYYRGPNYEVWTFANGMRQWVSAMQAVWNGSHWVDYIFQDLYDVQGKYVIQTGLIAVEIFDYYAKFYDPNMTEVRLYDERWEIQQWKSTGQGSWSNIGAQSGTPVYNIATFNDGVNITKSFHSWAGWLNITYTFSEQLKHTVTWQSEMGILKTFGVLQKWSGIVGSKCRHEHGSTNILSATQINGTYFEFLKLNYDLSVLENQWSAREFLQPVTVDLHAQGMKCDFIFSNWTLQDQATLTIDPITSTFSSNLDGWVAKSGDTYSTVQSATTGDSAYETLGINTLGQAYYPDSPYYYVRRLWFKFDTSSIPDGVNITSATFRFYCDVDHGETTLYFHIQNGTGIGNSIDTTDYDSFDGTNYDDGNCYRTGSEGDFVGFHDIVLNNFTIIDKTGNTTFCSRISTDVSATAPSQPYNEEYISVRMSEYGGTDYDPSLIVTYIPAPTIGEFQAPTIAYSDTQFLLGCTVDHTYGVAYLDYVTLEISASVILKWDNATDTFSEYSDINNLCILFADESAKTVVNGTAYRLTWKISLSANFPEGSVSVYEENTKAFDSYGQYGSGSQSSLFTFESLTPPSGSGDITPEPTTTIGPVTLPKVRIQIPTWGYWVIGGTVALMGIGALMQSGKKKRRVRGVRTQPKKHKPKRTKRDTRGRYK